MNWYHYVGCFFAGMFFANFVPHFVKGVCGDRFPTPFARPPGRGLSSPVVNVLWSLLNVLIGYILARAGRLASGGELALAACFAGAAGLSIMCSLTFARKRAA